MNQHSVGRHVCTCTNSWTTCKSCSFIKNNIFKAIHFFFWQGRQPSIDQQLPSFADSHLHQTDHSYGIHLDSGTRRKLETNCIPAVSFYCAEQHARYFLILSNPLMTGTTACSGGCLGRLYVNCIRNDSHSLTFIESYC